jgi:RNA polymerase sigma-70 factor, ECF subfamily
MAAQQVDRLQLFDALYAEHARNLHDYFVARINDAELARDLLQDTCIRLWRGLEAVGDLSPERRRSWLFTVARNLVVDHYRARATAAATRNKLAQGFDRASAPAADVAITDNEMVYALDDAIGRLPEALRTVLVLQVLGERTSAEIGQLLDRPPGTVRYQLAQARRLLAEQLRLDDTFVEEATT